MRLRSIVVVLFLSLTIAIPAWAQNPVTYWSEQVEDVISSGRPPGSAQVLLGLVHVAVYDAVVAIDGGFTPFAVSASVTRPASVNAAVATAAWRVGRARLQPAQQATLDARYIAYLATLPDEPSTTNGVDVGNQVASGLLAMRASDGFENTVVYVQPPPGPGVWEPTAASAPVDVKLQQVRPLTFESPSAFRPDGPNALNSAEYAADVNEVKSLGRIDSVIRSAEQTAIAQFWSEHTAVQWNRGVRTLAGVQGLSVSESARMLAMVHASSADAIIACFEAKYAFASWRPVHAIRRADMDDNPDTEADVSWSPLLGANHPEYPSGHGCFSAAVTEALAAYFGSDRISFSMEWRVGGAVQAIRDYTSFHEALKEVIDARVYGGLHFRNTMMEAARLGRKIARHVTTHYFTPLD